MVNTNSVPASKVYLNKLKPVLKSSIKCHGEAGVRACVGARAIYPHMCFSAASVDHIRSGCAIKGHALLYMEESSPGDNV